MKKGDRKTRIELTVRQARKLSGLEAALAWDRLWTQLEAMCEPEARAPRFNGLLRAIWAAATNEPS